MRPRPQTRPETGCKVPIRSLNEFARPPEEVPEGWVFHSGSRTRGPYKGWLDIGWFIEPPPGVRGRVVEILNNVSAGLRVQGPVVVSLGTHLVVYVDSDVPLEPETPLFLLVFEQDFKTHAHCLN